MLGRSMNIMLFCNRNAYVLFGTYLKYSEIEIINWHRVANNQADTIFNTIVVIVSNSFTIKLLLSSRSVYDEANISYLTITNTCSKICL